MNVSRSMREPFRDGVFYSVPEALYLSSMKVSKSDLKKIHMVKKIFDGEILVPLTDKTSIVFEEKNNDS